MPRCPVPAPHDERRQRSLSGPRGDEQHLKTIFISTISYLCTVYIKHISSQVLSHALPIPPAHPAPTFMPSSYPSKHTLLNYTGQMFVFSSPVGWCSGQQHLPPSPVISTGSSRPTEWKQRTNSCKLFSGGGMYALVPTHMSASMHTHIPTHPHARAHTHLIKRDAVLYICMLQNNFKGFRLHFFF